MGDTNIICKPKSSVPTTSVAGSATPASDSTPQDSPRIPGTVHGQIAENELANKQLVEEKNQALKTDLANLSLHPTPAPPPPATPQPVPAADVPAAGAGGSSRRTPGRGRRHIRNSLFEESDFTWHGYREIHDPSASYDPVTGLERSTGAATNGSLYSVNGTRSVNLPRRRDHVSVFPIGCMGCKADDTSTSPVRRGGQPASGADGVKPGKNKQEPMEADADDANARIIKEEQEEQSGRPMPCNAFTNSKQSALQRNPLTGEGYDDMDFITLNPIKKKGV